MIRPLITGFATTFKHLFRKEITVNYPDEKVPMFPKWRGKQVLMRDENGLPLESSSVIIRHGFGTLTMARSFLLERVFLGVSGKGVYEDNAGTRHLNFVGDAGILIRPNPVTSFGAASERPQQERPRGPDAPRGSGLLAERLPLPVRGGVYWGTVRLAATDVRIAAQNVIDV
jgi:hypothetical protein